MEKLKMTSGFLSMAVTCSCMGHPQKAYQQNILTSAQTETSSEKIITLTAGGSPANEIPIIKPKREKTTKAAPEVQEIKSVLKRYQRASAVSMTVDKEVHLALLDDLKKGKGHLWFSKSRLKVVIDEPESSLLLVDGQTVWMVTRLSEDPSGVVQVTKMKTAQVKKANALLAVLFGDQAIWDQFEVLKSLKSQGFLTVQLKPRIPGHPPDVTEVKMVLRPKEGEISEITYWDELGNQTSYKFADANFNAKLTAKDFKYVPPKNAEVSEF